MSLKRLARDLALTLALILCLAPAALAQNIFEEEVVNEKHALLGANLALQAIEGGYKYVDTATLKHWMDEKKPMVLVDTMPFEASYQKGHFPGAKQFLFPIPTMTAWDNAETEGKSQEDFVAMLGTDKDALIVFYCGFVKCTRSHNGALWAKKLGYTNVYRHPGGLYAWKGAGFPMSK